MKPLARWLWVPMALALLLAPGDALAKKKKGGKGKKGAEVELIGVGSMDRVFKKVRKLDNKVDSAEQSRKTGKNNVRTAMGVQPGVGFAQTLTQLKKLSNDKVSVAKEGSVPKLKAAPDAPKEVQKGLDAVNTALASYSQTLADLAATPKEADELIKRCKAFPDQLKNEIGANPIKAITMIKELKTTKNNIKIASQLPKRIGNVSTGLTKDVNLIVTTFGGIPLPLP